MPDKLELPDNLIAEGHAPERTSVQPGEDYFAPSKQPTHPFGVLYQGDWETPFDGTAIAVRKHARALAATGIPVLLKSFNSVVVNASGVAEPVKAVGVPIEVQAEIGNLNMSSVGRVFPIIKHAVVPNAERVSQMLMRGMALRVDDPEVYITSQQAVYSATIMYTVWERNYVHPDIALHLSEIGECWVPCEHNKQLLRSAGVDRVRVVPHPYDPEEDICKLVRRARVPDGRHFYSIGAWQPRKGFHELLGAFLLQFRRREDVSLTIKYSGGGWPNYPSPKESIEQWLSESQVRRNSWTRTDIALLEGMQDFSHTAAPIRLVAGRIPRSRIVELHYRHNIYVCSSHGEAWCLPAFDAKLAGNRMVHVAYGGTADFDDDEDVRVPWSLGDVPRSYNWEPEAQWANYDVWSLAGALGSVVPPARFAQPLGFEERFGAAAVGSKMADAIQALSKSLYAPAAEYYEGCRGRGE